MLTCAACEAPLSEWEPNPCACLCLTPKNNADVMYAVACSVGAPVHVRDYVRLAYVDFTRRIDKATANAVIAPDPRFCWAGKGLYGLFRHGPLPGPRNLEEAARLLLCASDRPLTMGAIEYTLKSIGYRFTSASLSNAVNRSPMIERRWHDGHFQVQRTCASADALLSSIPVLPVRLDRSWREFHKYVENLVEHAVLDRAERLRIADNMTTARFDWE